MILRFNGQPYNIKQCDVMVYFFSNRYIVHDRNWGEQKMMVRWCLCVYFFQTCMTKLGVYLGKKINWHNGHYFLQDFFKVIHFSSGCSKTHIQMQERFQKSFILTRNFLAVKFFSFNSINQVFVRHCKGTQFVSNSFFNT